MERENINATVKEVVQGYLDCNMKYDPEATFGNLGIDSLDTMAVFVEVEDELDLDIELDEEFLEELNTPFKLSEKVDSEING